MADGPTADGPARRRSSWSLKSIVEDVSGKSIGEFQEPGRPVHPYLQVKGDGRIVPPSGASAAAQAAAAAPSGEQPPYDPVGHLYPPLVGAAAREFHGPEHQHHAETLAKHPTVPAGVGERPRSASPLHRPERLYLHYLLLHLDRLSDAGLAYLHAAVDEELLHRARSTAPPPPTTPVPAEPLPAAPPPAPAASTPSVPEAPLADLPPPPLPTP